MVSVIETKRNKSNENLELRKKKLDSYKSRTVDNLLALLVGKETHAITFESFENECGWFGYEGSLPGFIPELNYGNFLSFIKNLIDNF